MTNREYYEGWFATVREALNDARKIQSGEVEKTEIDLELIKVKERLIKQGNNTYTNALKHDVARAKLENYQSSFLDEEE